MKKLMLVAMMLLGFAAMSYAQNSNNSTATINAYIEKGLTISVSNSTLNLGNLVAGITPAPVSPLTSGVPAFTVTGDGGHQVNVTFDASVMLYKSAPNADSISFTTNFEGNSTGTQSGAGSISSPVTLSGVSPAAGNYYMWLGGQLTDGAGIPAAQTPGSYTGTFHVSISY